jgi:hypothetical protein
VRDVRHAVGHARIEGEVSCKSLSYPLPVALDKHHHILVVFLRDTVQWFPNSSAASLFSESKPAWEKNLPQPTGWPAVSIIIVAGLIAAI